MVQATVAQPGPAAAEGGELDKVRLAWKEIGLSTQPADRRAAEAAIRKLYAAAGLAEPQHIVWCGSPFSQGVARAIVLDPGFVDEFVKAAWKNVMNASETDFRNNIADCFRSSMRLFDTGSVKRELMDAIKRDVGEAMTAKISAKMTADLRARASESVWNSIWSSAWTSVDAPLAKAFDCAMRQLVQTRQRASFETSFRSGMNECVGACVKAQVWDGAMDAAWANIRAAIGSQIRVRAYEELWRNLQVGIWENIAMRIGEAVKASSNDSAQKSGYGQHDAYWLAFYDYFRSVHGLAQETEAVVGLLELARAGGWFAPHEKLCWICERPSRLLLDDEGRLLEQDEPALLYPDGWGLHGHRKTAHMPAALHTA
ncbi:MAG TPA: hypothetical protein VIG66_04830 [Noviherbaspirillum sp.]